MVNINSTMIKVVPKNSVSNKNNMRWNLKTKHLFCTRHRCSHNTPLVKQYLGEFVFDLPPHSSDVVFCDIYFIPKLKRALKGEHLIYLIVCWMYKSNNERFVEYPGNWRATILFRIMMTNTIYQILHPMFDGVENINKVKKDFVCSISPCYI